MNIEEWRLGLSSQSSARNGPILSESNFEEFEQIKSDNFVTIPGRKCHQFYLDY